MGQSEQGQWYDVGEGEGIASIAKRHGYLWKTLWEHDQNGKLKAQRRNPNQLLRGDRVFLPPKGVRQEARPTDARHAFKRKGEPTRLKLQLTSLGKPRANEAYTLTFADTVINGTTDDQGRIDQPIPGQVGSAQLSLGGGRETHTLAVGLLDPVDQVSGVQHRLKNLGFDCKGELGEIGEATRQALLRFQRANALEETGEADDATRARLNALHV
ncbi:MAG: peptidoglycan-binding protein [Pseudoxanthomonas sp.]